MRLGWNEIKDRAIEFVKKWKTVKSQDCAVFTDDFFGVFDVSPWKVDTFDKCYLKNGGKDASLLLWQGVVAISVVKKGEDKNKAYQKARQALDDVESKHGNTKIIVSDLQSISLYDGEKTVIDVSIEDFYKEVAHFGFLVGYKVGEELKTNSVDKTAFDAMSAIADKLKEECFDKDGLEVFLLRLTFCAFAQDTAVFEKASFYSFVKKAKEEGQAHKRFNQLFNRLGSKEGIQGDEFGINKAFPYVGGELFSLKEEVKEISDECLELILKALEIDWKNITPEIFGAMLQSVMDRKERRATGAFYTSEENILKTIKPLFLDELERELEGLTTDIELKNFHDKLLRLKFLDPACGCGNFLVVAYRELRKIEKKVIDKLYAKQTVLDVTHLFKVNVGQFYGIELLKFPALIAQVTLWLADHQSNIKVGEEYGRYYVRLPIKNQENIVVGNALTMDWNSVVDKKEIDYVFGNPPFIGAKLMTREQYSDLVIASKGCGDTGVLDYVSGWYFKCAEYVKDTQAECSLVSTNSITQGEQATALWKPLMMDYGMRINFAHRTFKWSSGVGQSAGVYCVIVGFGANGKRNKVIFDYTVDKEGGTVSEVSRINQYLLDARTVFVEKRNSPVSKVTPISKGCQPTDGGNLILSLQEKQDLILEYPTLSPYVKRLLGAEEFLQAKQRFCLWLVDANEEILQLLPVKERVERVRQARLASSAEGTKRLADTPHLFRETYNYSSYVVIPSVSTEKRRYVPIGFFGDDTISTNANLIIPNATLYDFAILSSAMHMAWMGCVCGRLKSDYRYSAKIVYNNFVWPKATEEQKQELSCLAQNLLDVRSKYQDKSLTQLYDVLKMPKDLMEAHLKIDRYVDKLYNRYFSCDNERVTYLLDLYEQTTGCDQISIEDI